MIGCTRPNGRVWLGMRLPRLRLAPLLLVSLLFVSIGCEGATSASAGDVEISEDALVVLPGLGRWTRHHARPRGRLRIGVTLEAGARYRVTVTDHWGWRAGQARPAVTLDLDVRDARGGSLTGHSHHNTSTDENGTTPDPIPFIGPTSRAVILDIREVDGYESDFDVRVDRGATDVAVLEPPPGMVVHRRGDTSTNVSPATAFAALLAGGGKDHDAATSALIAAGGHGDALILRMDDTGGAYASYFVERGAHAATEVALDPASGNDDVIGPELAALRARADSPWLLAKIEAAEILFLAGGNQTKYVDAWRGTALAGAVSRLVARGGAIGGTSAGMHALAGVVHTPRGEGDSVTSSAVLGDPYIGEGEYRGTRSLAFSPSPFLVPLLAGVVTDTHWTQRARLGRSLGFLGRILTDNLRPVGGVALLACDEGVGVLLDAAGRGRVFGPPAGGSAFLFRPDAPPDRCVDDRTIDWRAGVAYVRVEGTPSGTATLDLGGAVGPARARVVDGVVTGGP